jgi:hypothetical protein
MLAVVDDLTGSGMLIGGRASPEVRTPFIKLNLVSGIGESATGGESGKTTAYDRN